MGHVCFIPGTTDFFIAYGDHPEWGTAHTVGGGSGWAKWAGGLVAMPPRFEYSIPCRLRCLTCLGSDEHASSQT